MIFISLGAATLRGEGHSLTRYILVTFGISWLLWLPVTFATFDLPSFSNAYVSSWFTDLLQGKANTWAHWLVLLGGVLGPLLGGMAAWHYLAGRKSQQARCSIARQR